MTLNPEHIKEVMELNNQSGYFKLLSMSVIEVGVGYSVVEMRLEEKHLHLLGGTHGGVYASLIDSAAWWALYGNMDEVSGFVSLDLSVDNLISAKEGVLIAKGKTKKVGKTICPQRPEYLIR